MQNADEHLCLWSFCSAFCLLLLRSFGAPRGSNHATSLILRIGQDGAALRHPVAGVPAPAIFRRVRVGGVARVTRHERRHLLLATRRCWCTRSRGEDHPSLAAEAVLCTNRPRKSAETRSARVRVAVGSMGSPPPTPPGLGGKLWTCRNRLAAKGSTSDLLAYPSHWATD